MTEIDDAVVAAALALREAARTATPIPPLRETYPQLDAAGGEHHPEGHHQRGHHPERADEAQVLLAVARGQQVEQQHQARGRGQHQHRQERPQVDRGEDERRVHRGPTMAAVAWALLCTCVISACTLGSVIVVKVVG